MVAVRGCQKGPQTILKITLKEGIVEFISYRYCYCWSLVQNQSGIGDRNRKLNYVL